MRERHLAGLAFAVRARTVRACMRPVLSYDCAVTVANMAQMCRFLIRARTVHACMRPILGHDGAVTVANMAQMSRFLVGVVTQILVTDVAQRIPARACSRIVEVIYGVGCTVGECVVVQLYVAVG